MRTTGKRFLTVRIAKRRQLVGRLQRVRSDGDRRGASTTPIDLAAPLSGERTTSSVKSIGENATSWRNPRKLIADMVGG